MSTVLHIIIVCNGQRGSTLPPTSADSLSELISELEKTQYDCNVFMMRWRGTLPYRYTKAALWHLWCSVLKADGYEILLCMFAVLEGSGHHWATRHANPGVARATFPIAGFFESNCLSEISWITWDRWTSFWAFASWIQSQLCFALLCWDD